MASNDKTGKSEDAGFSFGVRELRQARESDPLALDAGALSVQTEVNAGFDPYNTSGGFDRKKNWVRVGKR
jgi:hypothetical protein